jgi:hypothetical protein
MDRNDKALLDRQLWGVAPHPPSLIGLAFAAVFFGGLVIGSFLFARAERHARLNSTDVTGTISSHKRRLQVPHSKLHVPDLKIERPGVVSTSR